MLGSAALSLPTLLVAGGVGRSSYPTLVRVSLSLAVLSILGGLDLLSLGLTPPEGVALVDGRFTTSPSSRIAEAVAVTSAVALCVCAPSASVSLAGRGEHALLIAVYAGSIAILPRCDDLILALFVLSLANLALYPVLGSFGRSEGTVASSVRYLTISALASVTFGVGVVTTYAVTGTIDLTASSLLAASSPSTGTSLAPIGGTLLALGLLTKLGVAPLHSWAPDTYGGVSPLPASVAMVAPKLPLALTIAGLATLLPGGYATLVPFALASAAVGAIGMGSQSTLRRWLALSTIAHGGYTLLIAMSGDASGVTLYALTYLPATALLLTLVLSTETGRGNGNGSLTAYSGMGVSHPATLLPTVLAILSLLGLPPLAGFIGKWYLLSSLVSDGGPVAWLAVGVVLVTSLIGAAGYLRIVRVTALDLPTVRGPSPSLSPAGAAAVSTLTGAILLTSWTPASLLAAATTLQALSPHRPMVSPRARLSPGRGDK